MAHSTTTDILLRSLTNDSRHSLRTAHLILSLKIVAEFFILVRERKRGRKKGRPGELLGFFFVGP
jgi:hypothetical protein